MIFRLLLIAAAVWILWRLARIGLQQLERRPPPGEDQDPPFVATARCPQCGTHLPQEQMNAQGRCPRCGDA